MCHLKVAVSTRPTQVRLRVRLHRQVRLLQRLRHQQRLLRLLRFRNAYPAFAGSFELHSTNRSAVAMAWRHGEHYCHLLVDLKFRSATITYRDEDSGDMSVMLATADPNEGEISFESGADIVATVPMPDEIALILCLANRGRLNARVGGLSYDKLKGENGLV